MKLMIGDMLCGFCGGWFGRDSFYDKRVEALGADWIVVRNLDGPFEGRPDFASNDPRDGRTVADLWKYCDRNPERETT